MTDNSWTWVCNGKTFSNKWHAIKEHNHSPAFYALLDRLMPGWQSVKARLDGMVGEVLAR